MSDTSLKLNFSNDDDTEGYSLTMEQKPIEDYTQSANLSDVTSMRYRSMMGLTAYSYSRSGSPIKYVKDKIEITIPFYVWSIPYTLPYTVSINSGKVTSAKRLEQTSEQNVVVPMSDRITFPYEIELQSWEWETPCYNSDGEVVSDPSITVVGNVVNLSAIVFGVARVKYIKKGYRHNAVLVFPKTVDGVQEVKNMMFAQRQYNKITNINAVVTARYTDEEGEEQEEYLHLLIPDECAMALSTCAGGSLKINDCDPDITKSVTYYYSTCTGEILDIVREEIDPCEG